MDYEVNIGMEIHAELLTRSKVFCSCPVQFGAPPNTLVCPVCLGLPGALPVLNKRAVEFAITTALALNCGINRHSIFHRKNYYYPDLPKNYQISQYDSPIGIQGYLEIETEGGRKRIRIRRVHLEEDTGKLIHSGGRITGSDISFVDFNRSSVPLLEIVSEPDISSPEEAKEYLSNMRDILVFLGVCDGKMEEGSMRCEANISVRRKGSEKLGIKTELKNINSFRSVERALIYEINRQIDVVSRGGEVIQETRHWDEKNERTVSMRGKEEAHDYRYFPEPDLVPLEIEDGWIESLKSQIPELPDEKYERYKKLGLTPYEAKLLAHDLELSVFFDRTVDLYNNPKNIANWLLVDVTKELKDRNKVITETSFTPEIMVELLDLIDQGVISGRIAKDILPELIDRGVSPKKLVEEKGLIQITDISFILSAIDQVLRENAGVVEEYKKGKEKSFMFLVGQVMKLTRGRANPKLVNELLKKALG
ncbi:MAG: Asp-tRNA(Asn)/Glu-tRNA(Gln) amidotransferase subunit GatB [Dictyoglomi bacterium]|nr:Asp-tRNA(Asn)/Glu-tRNA(Gln) amidotransferase subunit GatB [Dictyoglomota bacterium]